MVDFTSNVLQTLQDYKAPESNVYNSEFFRKHLKYRPIYDFIGDLIMGHFHLESAIDFGCGCGFLIERIFRHGASKILGIEGSSEACEIWKSEIIEPVRDRLIIADITKPVDTDGTYDMAVCMEVAEHIHDEFQDVLVTKIASSANKWVWWTAAQPGQKGDGHINCRPLSYWENAFAKKTDFHANWEKTYIIKQSMLQHHAICLGYPWFRDNLIIFERI